MAEFFRIPITDLHPGQRIERVVDIKPSSINETGSLGKRHFQFSVVSTGTTRYMQSWDSKVLTVELRNGSTLVTGQPTTTPFYLVSQVANGPTGLSFDLENGKQYSVSIQVSSSTYPSDCELVFAPNWDGPMFLKDQIVGAMAMPLFSVIFGWLEFTAVLLILVSVLVLYRHSIRRNHTIALNEPPNP